MPFADELIGAPTVAELARQLSAAAPERSWSTVRRVGTVKSLSGLGLSERARAVRDALLSDGPADYWPFQELIRTALRDPAFTGWMIWPVTEAVATLATRGEPVDPGDPAPGGEFEAGLELLSALTSRLTGEFALRTFLAADLERTSPTSTCAGWPAKALERGCPGLAGCPPSPWTRPGPSRSWTGSTGTMPSTSGARWPIT